MSSMDPVGHRGVNVRPEEIRIASAAAAEAVANLPAAVESAWVALPAAARHLAGWQTEAALRRASAVSHALARRLASQVGDQQAAVLDGLRALQGGDVEAAALFATVTDRSLT